MPRPLQNFEADNVSDISISYEIRRPQKTVYANEDDSDNGINDEISRLDTQSCSSEIPHHSMNLNHQNLNQYIFSKDFLPVRYDRHSLSDLPLKVMVIIELSLNLALFIIFLSTTVTRDYFSSIFGIIEYVIIWFFFILTIFWVNYKVHSLLFSFYRMFIDLDCTKRNSKYYSGLEIPDFYVQSEIYPHITIQIPIYKENLHNTIKPTLLHCCREADRYMDETSAYCNIIVCDDGYNIISEADRCERVQFYQDIGIGFTARPHPSKYPRKGRFKKAGNLNFSLNFYELFMMEDVKGPKDIRAKRQRLLDLGAVYGGDVTYGQYVFLIDSDTRLPDIPMNENGCLKRLAKEMLFDGKDVLFIQCYTGPYMSVKTASEKSIFNHTCNIYNSILVATACKSMAPLVGHNAFLNMSGLQECAQIDEGSGFKYFWAEDRISEDFDLMMRGCEKGYIGRYASHAGIFLEGVSFSYMSEYFKVSKFACGAAELIYNPMSDWYKDGILSSDLIGFVKSTKVEWYNKFIILSYVLNFIAIAAGHFGLLFNLFFCRFLYSVLPFYLLPINLMWEALFIWTVCGTVASYVFGLRLGFDKWLYFKQMLRETLFLTCLYGSISVRFSIMSFTHLFKLNLSFGATAKDDEKITLMDWVMSTPMETSVYTLYTIFIFLQLFALTTPDNMTFVLYFGCVPMIWSIVLFWAGPLLWDVCRHHDDKTINNSLYDKDDRMFQDKYLTQLPNSPAYTKIIVGSSAKLAPLCKEAMTDSATYTSRSVSSHMKHSSHSHSHGKTATADDHSFTSPRVYNEDEVFYRLGLLKRENQASKSSSDTHHSPRQHQQHQNTALTPLGQNPAEYASHVSSLSSSCSLSSGSSRKSINSIQALKKLQAMSAAPPYARPVSLSTSSMAIRPSGATPTVPALPLALRPPASRPRGVVVMRDEDDDDEDDDDDDDDASGPITIDDFKLLTNNLTNQRFIPKTNPTSASTSQQQQRPAPSRTTSYRQQ